MVLTWFVITFTWLCNWFSIVMKQRMLGIETNRELEEKLNQMLSINMTKVKKLMQHLPKSRGSVGGSKDVLLKLPTWWFKTLQNPQIFKVGFESSNILTIDFFLVENNVQRNLLEIALIFQKSILLIIDF